MKKTTLTQFRKAYFRGIPENEIPPELLKGHYQNYKKSGKTLKNWINET